MERIGGSSYLLGSGYGGEVALKYSASPRDMTPEEQLWAAVVRTQAKRIMALEGRYRRAYKKWPEIRKPFYIDPEEAATLTPMQIGARTRAYNSARYMFERELMDLLTAVQHEILWLGEDEPNSYITKSPQDPEPTGLHGIMGILEINEDIADDIRESNLAGLLFLREQIMDLLEEAGRKIGDVVQRIQESIEPVSAAEKKQRKRREAIYSS